MSKYYSFSEQELVKLLTSLNNNVNRDNFWGYLRQSNAVYCNSDQNHTHVVYAYHKDDASIIMDVLRKYDIPAYSVPDDWRIYHIVSPDDSIVDELNNYCKVCAVWDDLSDGM